MVPCPTRVYNPSNTSISSAIFVGLAVVNNRQTQRSFNIGNNRPHHTLCIAMSPNNKWWLAKVAYTADGLITRDGCLSLKVGSYLTLNLYSPNEPVKLSQWWRHHDIGSYYHYHSKVLMKRHNTMKTVIMEGPIFTLHHLVQHPVNMFGFSSEQNNVNMNSNCTHTKYQLQWQQIHAQHKLTCKWTRIFMHKTKHNQCNRIIHEK